MSNADLNIKVHIKDYPKLTDGQINYATVVAFLAWSFSVFDFILCGTLLPVISEDMGWSTAYSAQVSMYISILVFLVSFTVGPIAEKFGRSTGLTVVTAGTAMSSLLTGFASGVVMLVAVRAISGLGYQEQAINSAYMNEITTNVKRKGFRYGFVQGGWPIGAMIAAVVSTLFLDDLGWRGVFWVGTIPAVIIVLLRFKLKESPKWLEMRDVKSLWNQGKKEEAIALGTHYGIDVNKMMGHNPISQLFAPDLRKHTIFLLAANILIWFPCQVFSVLGTTVLTAGKGLSIENALVLTIIINVCAYGGYLVSGALGDRFGRRNIIFIFWGLCGIFFSIMLFAASSYYVIMITFLLGLFCMLGGWATIMTYQGESYPTRVRAQAVSFQNAWGYLGAIISSGLFSFLIGATNIIMASFLAGALPAIVGACCLLGCKKVAPGQKLEDIAQ
ncbi:MAG: MFS transporter [Clostridiales Family XIII bacterium]|jgi:MFS family permease|nr:MFS transporter [Clostridiales Family XIII bacterium]